jgi:hypothetical protein
MSNSISTWRCLNSIWLSSSIMTKRRASRLAFSHLLWTPVQAHLKREQEECCLRQTSMSISLISGRGARDMASHGTELSGYDDSEVPNDDALVLFITCIFDVIRDMLENVNGLKCRSSRSRSLNPESGVSSPLTFLADQLTCLHNHTTPPQAKHHHHSKHNFLLISPNHHIISHQAPHAST